MSRPALLLGALFLAGCAPSAEERALRDPDPAIRTNAVLALEASDRPVPRLVRALEDRDLGVRQAALEVLGRLGPRASKALPAVIDRLEDKEPYLRMSAVRTLVALDPEGKVAVRALAGALGNRQPEVRLTALEALRRFGPRARPALAAIAARMKGEDERFQTAAIAILSSVPADAEEVLPSLVASLSAPNRGVRLAALQGLRKLGSRARPAVPAIAELRNDPDSVIAQIAVQTLEWLGSRLPPLDRLQDERAQIRAAAAEELGRTAADSDAGQAVPALAHALSDPEPQVRRAAANSLSRFGERAAAALPALIGALRDGDASVRQTAAWALGDLVGQDDRPVLPLIEALKDEDDGVFDAAQRSLARSRGIRASLARTGCFGRCPSYAVTIYLDGTLLYQGGRFVKVEGRRLAQLTSSQMAALDAAFAGARYFSLEDSYSGGPTDCPSTLTSFRIAGRAKAIEHYMCAESAPPDLTELENRIDTIVGSRQWVGTEENKLTIEQ